MNMDNMESGVIAEDLVKNLSDKEMKEITDKLWLAIQKQRKNGIIMTMTFHYKMSDLEKYCK